MSVEKTIIVFLGILINTTAQMISIPLEKKEKALELLKGVARSRKTTVLKLQLTGLLNFMVKAIYPGRAFTRCMYSKFTGLNKKLKQHYHVNVDAELRTDCQVWIQFLQDERCVCRPFINFHSVLVADELNFFTDAAGAQRLGLGCVFGLEWTFPKWKPRLMEVWDPSIAFLELFALTIAIDLWIEKLQNRRVVVFCDNLSVVNMLNK